MAEREPFRAKLKVFVKYINVKERNKIMKATYQKPKTEISIISGAQMIATSNGGLLGNGDNPNELDLSTAATTEESSGNLSRRSVWDEEEEEENW